MEKKIPNCRRLSEVVDCGAVDFIFWSQEVGIAEFGFASGEDVGVVII